MTPGTKRILIATENDSLFADLKGKLQALGYEVEQRRHNGFGFLNSKNGNNTLILSDIHLLKNAADEIPAAKAELQKYQVPVVFLVEADKLENDAERVKLLSSVCRFGFVPQTASLPVFAAAVENASRLFTLEREKGRVRILNAVQTGVYIYDLSKSVFEYINPEFKKFSGWSLEELNRLGNEFFRLIHPAERERVIEHFSALRKMKKDAAHICEYRCIKKNGDWTWCLSRAIPFERDEKGTVIKIIASVINITERKKLEEEREKLIKDLNERLKEMKCLSDFSHIVEHSRSLEIILEQTVNKIPAGWQFPDRTAARIRYGKNEYLSNNFAESTVKQKSNIIVNGKKAGAIEIFLSRSNAEHHEPAFLTTEIELLDLLAERLGRVIERIEAVRILEINKAGGAAD